MLPLLEAWKTHLVDLFFPRRCVSCGREGRFLCRECIQQLPPVPPFLCPGCDVPLPESLLCSHCKGPVLPLRGICAPYAYQNPLREAVLAFKYRGVQALGEELAGLLAPHLATHPIPMEVLVPVPLHPGRSRERGYNQAEVLGRELARRISLPVAPHALLRVRATVPQARLTSREERLQNVKGAFSPGPDSIQGKSVLLVDDVCTTGATLQECARTLQAAGAASVWGLTIARGE